MRLQAKDRVRVINLSGCKIQAAVVELADARDLKSLGRNTVPVRVRSAAPKKGEIFKFLPFLLQLQYFERWGVLLSFLFVGGIYF